jgi:hypothetical protein
LVDTSDLRRRERIRDYERAVSDLEDLEVQWARELEEERTRKEKP